MTHDNKFSLPSSKLNHFKLQGMEYLLQLSSKSNCKYHTRIWRMRSFFLLARYLEKQIEREDIAKAVAKSLGNRYNKIDPAILLTISKVSTPKYINERPNLREEKQ